MAEGNGSRRKGKVSGTVMRSIVESHVYKNLRDLVKILQMLGYPNFFPMSVDTELRKRAFRSMQVRRHASM